MKNKILSFVGIRAGGRHMNVPEITPLSPRNHPVITPFRKVITMILFLFTFAIGNVWGDQTFTVQNPAASKRYVQDNITINGEPVNGTVKNVSTVSFNINSGSYAPFFAISKAKNIKAIEFNGARNTSGSTLTNAFTLKTSADAITYSTPATGFTVELDNNGTKTYPTSLTNLQMVGKNQSYSTKMTITFDNPVMAVTLTPVAQTYIDKVVVTYDDEITPTAQLCEVHMTSATAATLTGLGSWTTTSLQSGSTYTDTETTPNTYYYNKSSGTYGYINLGEGNEFQEGDEIWLDLGSNSRTTYTFLANSTNNTSGAVGIASAGMVCANGQTFAHYITKKTDPWVGEQTLYIMRGSSSGSNYRLYQISIHRAPTCDPIGVAATGTATSVTHNSATLPFTMDKTTGVSKLTIEVFKNSDDSKVATYNNITPATSGSQAATGLDEKTTYYYKITTVSAGGDYCDGTTTAKSATFTTASAPSLTPTITGVVSPAGYGSISPASITVASGSAVSIEGAVLTCDDKTLTATPADATAEYTYSFVEWTCTTPVTADVDATATFSRTAKKYNLSWNKNADDAEALSGEYTSGETAFGTTIVKPNKPTRDGYKFLGWAESESGDVVEVPATMPAEAKSYFAKWQEIVCIGNEGGTVFSMSMKQVTDANKKALAADEKVYLGADDYATVTGGEATFTNTNSAKGKIEKANPGYLNFNGNAAYVILDLECKLNIGDSIIVANTSTNEMAFTTDATLADTYKTETADGKGVFVVPAALKDLKKIYCWRASSSTSLTFTGITVIRPAKYAMTFAKGDEDASGTMDAQSVIEKSLVTLPACTFTAPDGKEFDAWVVTKTAGGAAVSVTDGKFTMPQEAVTLTATWKAETVKYAVTYVLNGPSGDAPTSPDKAAGDVVTLAANPSWTGYHFDGWSVAETVSGNPVAVSEGKFTMPAAAVTITAQWTLLETKIYSLTGNIGSAEKTADNASVSAEALVLSNNSGRIKLTPKSGETFKTGDVVTISGTIGAGSDKDFGVTIYAADGSTKIVDVYAANAVVPRVATATLSADADYVFLKRYGATTTTLVTCEITRPWAEGVAAGLSYAESSIEKYSSDAAFTNPLTNANNLVVVYGSSDNAVATIDANGQVTIVGVGTATITAKSAVQTKAGTLYAAGTASYTLTVAAPPTFAVTYDNNGGEGTMTDSNSPYTEGAEVTLLDNTFTAPTNKIFGSWVATYNDGTEKTLTITNGKFTMPAYDVTVTAQWVDDNKVAKIGENYYESLPAAVEDATDGQTVYLLKDVAAGAGVMIAKADAKQITIDFGGFTYKAVSPAVGSAGTQNQAFHFEKGCDITLKNGTITSEGSVIKMLIQNYGDLTLENITLDGAGLEGSHRYVMSNNCGDVVIGDGTTITAKDGDVAFDVCATNYYPEGVTVTVKDGATVNGIVEYDVWGTKPADNKAELAIEGGTLNITWNVESALAEDAKSNLNVSGGVFNAAVPENYCAEGYIPSAEIAPGKYGVIATAKSVDFTASAVQALGVGNAMSTYNYTLASTSGVSFDDTNAYDTGLKMKNSTTNTLSFIVEPDKLVTIVTGNIAGMTYSVNEGAATPLNGGTDKDHLGYTYLYNADVQNIVLAETSETYNIIREINIHSPYEVSFDVNGGDGSIAPRWATPSVVLPDATNGTESLIGWFDGETKIGEAGESYTPTADITLVAHWEAVSTDARLASITLDPSTGVLSPAFDPDVVNYTYTMPYGTAAIPTITSATSVNANAQDPIIGEAAAAWGEAQTVKGVAQSGDKKTYTITMVKAPKDGTCIVKADLAAGSSAASITATSGAYKDADNIAINVAKDLKLGEAGNYVKVAVKDTYFQDGDIVELVLRTDKPASAWLQIFADEGTTLVAEMTSGVSTTAPNRLTISGVPANTSVLYLYRTTASATNMNPYPTSMAVYRSMNPVLKSITFDGTKVNVTSTSVAATLPHGADLTAVTAEYYWNGAGTAVVTTNEGAWAWGENTYKLTDKDGDATTYTITLTEADHYEAQIGTTGYETLVAAVAAASEDDVVKLLDNVDLMATGLTIAKNMTLDLNGFNIKAGERETNDIVVPASVKLTLVDNSTDADGKIYTEEEYAGSATGYGLVRVSGELLMQSGNIYAVIDSDPANLGQFAVVLGAGGKATIEGGQIKAGWYAISNNGNNTGSTIIVSGGELISTADYAIYNPAKESTVTVSGGVVYGAAGGIAMNRGELTVTGGTITSKDQGTTGTWGDGTGGLSNAAISASGKYESVEVEISGGTIIAEGTAVMITNGTTNPVEVAISGGQFSHVVPAEYCAPGFEPITTPNAQGKYEVEDVRVYIFDGSTMSDMATSPSGAISWAKVGSTMGAGDKNITYKDVHYTRALACAGSSAAKHFRIDVEENTNVKIEVIGMSNTNSGDSKIRHAWLTNSTEKGEYANAIAGLESDGYNPAEFETEWLEEGSYYLHADNTVAIFLIRVTPKTVPAKCEAPTITDMANSENCEGTTLESLSVSASVTDGGTLHYQWYKEEGATDVAVGTDAASYTPDAVGEYYVVVTNRKADMRDHSAVSNTITVSYVAAAQITTAPLNQRGEVDDVVTLSVVATGKNLSYKWFKCDDESGTNPVAIDPEETNASLNVTITAGMSQWYKVLVTSDCGNAEATARVSEFVPATPANVTESIVWDWESSAWPASGQVAFTDQVEDGTDLTPAYELLADADAIVPNNAAFRSDMLYGKGQWVWRSGNKFFQGTAIKFTTEVAGLVRVNYRSTGNNKEVQVTIAGTPAGKNKTSNFQWSEYVEVPAGAVEILCLSTDANKSLTRVQKIEFLAVGHERTLVVGDLGTVCLPNACIARGVTVYEYQGADEIGKIVFDELGANDLLEAGKPYIFQVRETNARFYYNTDPAVGTPDNSTALKGNLGATITFQPGSAEAANVYFVKDHAFWMAKNTGVKIGQYRAYLQMDEVTAVSTPAPAPGRRRISMAVYGEQVATGIENTGIESEAPRKVLINGELFIIRGEKMYDAKGQLVK